MPLSAVSAISAASVNAAALGQLAEAAAGT